jgi:hypothetical protein
MGNAVVTYIPVKGGALRFSGYYAGFTPSETNSYRELVTQILSTFKFTDSNIEPTTKPVSFVIPANWKKYTAVDPQFKITTSISLPPNFSFRFTGSEFTIQDSTAQEIWDFSTSVKGDENGNPYNTFTGGSRRVWYQNYLNGDYHTVFSDPPPQIIAVKETATHLALTIQFAGYQETHYVAAKNNLIQILKPSSEIANSNQSELKTNLDIIFSSIQTNFEK